MSEREERIQVIWDHEYPGKTRAPMKQIIGTILSIVAVEMDCQDARIARLEGRVKEEEARVCR